MSSLLAALKKSPQLPVYAEAVAELLKREKAEREAFYAAALEAEGKREFINGKTVVQDAGDRLGHLVVRENVATLLSQFVRRHRLGVVLVEKALCVFPRNDYMPDIAFFRAEKARGFAPDQWKFPTPDLVVEVLSPSTRRRDYGVKFEDYGASGVEEYWVVDPARETIEQHLAVDGVYGRVEPAMAGALRSRVLPGFDFEVRAAFDADLNAAALARILAARPVSSDK